MFHTRYHEGIHMPKRATPKQMIKKVKIANTVKKTKSNHNKATKNYSNGKK